MTLRASQTVVRPPLPAGRGSVAPHKHFIQHYTDDAQKREWLRSIFDETAQDYDRVERWLALGSGRWYRRKALLRAGLRPGMAVTDVACGTGLVSREALRIVGESGGVLGVDPSEGMRRLAVEALGIDGVDGRAESIPSPDDAFDFVSMGYALRHVEDLGKAFAEFARVLRPGGRVCVLEITAPRSRPGRWCLKAYMRVVAWLSCLLRPGSGRTRELWRYYWDTMDRCVRPEVVLDALRDAGFTDVSRAVQLGVFSEYTATNALD